MNTKLLISLIYCLTLLNVALKCNTQDTINKYNNIDDNFGYNNNDDDDDDNTNNHTECISSIENYRQIVFEGGYTQSISYIGVLKAMKSMNLYTRNTYKFKRMTGVSMGCLFAFITALDIDGNLLETTIKKVDFFQQVYGIDANLIHDIIANNHISHDNTNTHTKDSNRKSWFSDFLEFFHLTKYLMNILQIWKENNSPGIMNIDDFIRYIENNILILSPYHKTLTTKITFDELHQITGHELTCYSTDLANKQDIRFNIYDTPNANVLHSIYTSLTLPGVHKALSLLANNRPLVDGSLSNNFPMQEYDGEFGQNVYTLGFSLRSFEETDVKKIKNTPQTPYLQMNDVTTSSLTYFNLHGNMTIFDYIEMIYKYMIRSKPDKYQSTRDIVYLDSPLKYFDRKMTMSDIDKAILVAYSKTIIFMNDKADTCIRNTIK